MAIFISIFGVLIVVFNFLPVRLYGELEFVFGVIKSLLVIGLILAGLIVDVGGSPSGEVCTRPLCGTRSDFQLVHWRKELAP